MCSQPFEVQVAAARDNLDQVQSQLKSVRLKMKECDQEISAIIKEQQKLEHKISESNLERKRMENEVIFQQLLSLCLELCAEEQSLHSIILGKTDGVGTERLLCESR